MGQCRVGALETQKHGRYALIGVAEFHAHRLAVALVQLHQYRDGGGVLQLIDAVSVWSVMTEGGIVERSESCDETKSSSGMR
jgi:hypothetical protein